MCSFFGSGETWLNFLEPLIIRASKFWTAWSLRRLLSAALDETEEQLNNLLNTKVFIVVVKVDLLNKCLTRLI